MTDAGLSAVRVAKFVLAILVAAAVLLVLGFALFSTGGSQPPDRGRGERIELSRQQ
jgi:hypothetical protein